MAQLLVMLDESSDTDTETSTESSNTDTSTSTSTEPSETSTVCPPARKRKRNAACQSDNNHKATSPARKRIKRDSEAILQAEVNDATVASSRSSSASEERRLRRMNKEEFDSHVAESLEALSEAIKAREDGDGFDEWFLKVTDALQKTTGRFLLWHARQGGGHDFDAPFQAVVDSPGFEKRLKLCGTREVGGHVEEWVEAVAKSQGLRSRR